MPENMRGKICLITGATFGIGRETALELASLGAYVVIVGRDITRTEETAQWIKEETGNHQVDYLLADLSSQEQVRTLATQFMQKYPKLDVLINNAGAIFSERDTTVDSIERTWALNHLAYFLLTQELLEFLKASAPARIINVASALHVQGKIDFADLQSQKNYSGMRSYSTSKLANVMFTYALARRLEGTGVTANCLHPGVVATGFGKGNSGFFSLIFKLARPFMTTPAKGARTSVYLASSHFVENITGQYFARCRAVNSSRASHDEEVQERLWSVSVRMIAKEA